MVQLSEGALQHIMKGGVITNPVMQVLGTKKIQSGNAEKERYRLLLSDGKYTISFAMLTIQLNEKCVNNYSVITVKRYITSVVNNSAKGEQRILLILEYDVVQDGNQVGQKIGNPIQLSDAPSSEGSSSSSSSNNPSTSVNKPQPVVSSGPATSLNTTAVNTQLTHPVSSLSPYHNKWVIRVRVSNKSPIRTWSNSRGEGRLFSVDFVDESGEIRCTAFRDMVDKYYDMLQLDKLYYVSKCQVKSANKQFSTLKNEYEMTIGSETIIQECDDVDGNIPVTKYDFVSIDKVAAMETGTPVDVIAICKEVGEMQSFQSKNTGRDLKKREVTLVDQSKTAIALTLWGSEAESFTGPQPGTPMVVSIKGAKVGEWGGGKTLSTVSSSQMRVDPDIPECYRLRAWYDAEGHAAETVNASARSGGGFAAPWMSFKEVQDQNLGHAEKGDYYQVMGTVLLMRSEKAIYKACPQERCNKKVIDLESGMYRCENCNTEYPNFKYRLLASMNVGDWSGNQWVSMFSSEAEKILGLTAQEVGTQIENAPDAMHQMTEKANFKQFVLKCRAKMETYNDENRLKTVVIRVNPIEYEDYNSHLIERINQLVSV